MSAFKSGLALALIQLKLTQSHFFLGVFDKKGNKGWCFYGLTLDQNKGKKIVLKDAEIIKKLASLDVFTTINPGASIRSFSYKNGTENDKIVPSAKLLFFFWNQSDVKVKKKNFQKPNDHHQKVKLSKSKSNGKDNQRKSKKIKTNQSENGKKEKGKVKGKGKQKSPSSS